MTQGKRGMDATSAQLSGRWPEVVRTVYARDPAVKSPWEAMLLYPGVHALMLHRVAHWLYRRRLSFLARLVSHMSRWLTGIEMHPGAVVGRRCFIDHGMGTVIGETAEIGDDVTIYQGVTLGGTGKETGKRHPTIERGVVISAGATILGNIVVGHGARVGAGAVVIKPVPPLATVVGVPGRVVAVDGRRVQSSTGPSGLTVATSGVTADVSLDHGNLPDPVAAALQQLEERIQQLERALMERPAEAARGY